MKLDEIRTLFDYNYWAFERVWNCIIQLTEKQYVKDVDYSTGSIRNIVVHVMSGTHRWIRRIQGKEIPPHLSFDDFDTFAKTKAKWDESRREVLDYVYSLDEMQLNEIVEWELPARGLQLGNYCWEIMLHVANHATDHRAQILTILHHEFHVETVEQDMLFYFVERKPK